MPRKTAPPAPSNRSVQPSPAAPPAPGGRYEYPMTYPPGFSVEDVPGGEELADKPALTDFYKMFDPTATSYPNNPIDYNAPWNVGPYRDYPGYDPNSGTPAPEPRRPHPYEAITPPDVAATRTQDSAVARVRSLIRLNNRYPTQLNQVLAEERPEPQRARSIRGLPAQLFEPGA